MQIRDHYIKAFRHIMKECNTSENQLQKHKDDQPYYLISPDATPEKVLAYTGRWIIRDEAHFVYNYHQAVLNRALKDFKFKPANNRIMHLDIGCGPSVFAWVVRDYMLLEYRKDPDEVEHIGYDHAENMIKLANLFQKHLKHLSVEYNLEGYFESDKIKNKLKDEKLSDCHVLITFGYALSQAVQDNKSPQAVQDFAEIIKHTFPSRSCILVASDAYEKEENRKEFHDAWQKLLESLRKLGVTVPKPVTMNLVCSDTAEIKKIYSGYDDENPPLDEHMLLELRHIQRNYGSWMYARLHME